MELWSVHSQWPSPPQLLVLLLFFFDFETLRHNLKGADGENITEQIGYPEFTSF